MKRWLALLFVLLAAAAPQARGYVQALEEHVSLNSQPATLSRVYAYGLDLISQRDAGGTVYYFIYDGHGSTRALTTTNAAVANVFAYDAYGTLIASNGVPQTVYLFAGEQFDPQLGFYYLRARYLNTGTGRFWTRDTWEGNPQDPLSLHKYLYAHANPVMMTDPSGQSVLGDAVLSVCIRVWMFAQSAAPVINAGRILIAGATLAAFVADAEFRGAYVSSLGGPGTAVTMLCAEIRMVANSGTSFYRRVVAKRNVINLNFSTGNAGDFRVKAADLQRAADRGELVVVNNPSSIRDASAQAAYRRAVYNRYVNFLKEIGMTEEQAIAQAQRKFQNLHVDHRIDLQVSGGILDPNARPNLRMLDGSVNTSIGRQLANEIERLGLQPGDQIHQVIVNGLPR